MFQNNPYAMRLESLWMCTLDIRLSMRVVLWYI
jgi:hypothetical protein